MTDSCWRWPQVLPSMAALLVGTVGLSLGAVQRVPSANKTAPAGSILFDRAAPNGTVGVAAINLKTQATRWIVKPTRRDAAAQSAVAEDGAVAYVASQRVSGRGSTAKYRNYRVYAIDGLGRPRGRADTQEEDELCPAWSPSAETIIELILDSQGRPERLRTDARGNEDNSPLTTDLHASGIDCAALLSDDSALDSYLPPGATHRELWSIDLRTGATAPWLTSANCDLGIPSVSADGSHVAFTALCTATPTGQKAQTDQFTTGIWNTRADATDPALVVSGRYEHTRPAWAPDGRWIAFNQRRPSKSASSKIMAVPVTGGKPIVVVPSPSGNPSWTTTS